MAYNSATSYKVVTYNLHGFNQGKIMLKELCDRFDIITVQEHWLCGYDLDKLVNFHDQFSCLAWSAMTDKVEGGILNGRPYGGIGLLIRKSLNVTVSQIQVHHSCRSVVCLLTFSNGFKLLLITVYFPCNYSSKDYVSVLLECLGFIEQCIDSCKCDGVMLLGDLNFDCVPVSCRSGFQHFKAFANDKKLVCCGELGFDKNPYTYFQESSGNHSVIDHVFVDTSLAKRIGGYGIFDACINLSDHWPVVCTLTFDGYLCGSVKHCDNKSNKSRQAGTFRWDKGNISGYYSMSYELLQCVNIPESSMNAKCDTFKCTHWNDIISYYCAIVDALKIAAESNIPFVYGNFYKHYWSQELDDLKRASIDAHQLWLSNGKPNCGLIKDMQRDAKYKYKLALRHAQRSEEFLVDDELSQLFLRKDVNKFWHKWQNKFSRSASVNSINGMSNDSDIASLFKDVFNDVYFDSYRDSPMYVNCLSRLQSLITADDCDCDVFDITDVENSLSRLKNGKASGLDGLTKEHISYAHPAIICHLKILFNLIYMHGFVPDDFGKGVTVPVPKDKSGDLASVSNYRPITISPVISKVFEYCLLNKFADSLQFSELQFGFRHNSSCSHAIFLLKEVVDYFVSHGSNVFMASLDARKAFDRVNHVKLFGVLLDKGVPARLVRIICDWYGKTVYMVKWHNRLSEVCAVKSGIRQGGILSPVLFNMYYDVIVQELSLHGYGCHMGGIFVGCIAYADDLILLSASLWDLQNMLNVCYEMGSCLDIVFNSAKSFLFKIGKACNETLCKLKLHNDNIKWVDRLRYLGVHLCAGRTLKFDISVVLRKAYGAANSIFAKTKYVSDTVTLNLIESYVFPVLLYGVEAIVLTPKQLNEMSVCLNNIYRRIFGMNRWESVKLIQFFCGRLDFRNLYNYRRLCFVCKLSTSTNSAITECYSHVKGSKHFLDLLSVYKLYQFENLNKNLICRRVNSFFCDVCLGHA